MSRENDVRENMKLKLASIVVDKRKNFTLESTYEDIADFILEREARILEPLRKHFTYKDDCEYCKIMANGINEALAIVEKA